MVLARVEIRQSILCCTACNWWKCYIDIISLVLQVKTEFDGANLYAGFKSSNTYVGACLSAAGEPEGLDWKDRIVRHLLDGIRRYIRVFSLGIDFFPSCLVREEQSWRSRRCTLLCWMG
jgi:hypothetical protein